jgi:hypothetical protein
MRHSLLWGIATTVVFLASLSGQTNSRTQPSLNSDVIEMARAGASESKLLAAVGSQKQIYDVSPQGLIALHAEGITEAVINRMILLNVLWYGPLQSPRLSNNDLIKMSKAGIPESVIVRDIRASRVTLDVSQEGIVECRSAGLSATAIDEMVKANSRLKFSNSFGSAEGVVSVKVASSKAVRYSAWVKTENVQDGYVTLYCTVHDAAGKAPQSDLTSGIANRVCRPMVEDRGRTAQDLVHRQFRVPLRPWKF